MIKEEEKESTCKGACNSSGKCESIDIVDLDDPDDDNPFQDLAGLNVEFNLYNFIDVLSTAADEGWGVPEEDYVSVPADTLAEMILVAMSSGWIPKGLHGHPIMLYMARKGLIELSPSDESSN